MFPPRMKRLFTTSIFLVIAASVFFVNQASALTVSPAKIEVAGDPGSVLKGTIRVYNEQEKEQTLYTSFENFEPNDDSGTPRFIGAEGGLATWFTAEPTLTVGADEETELTYRISIPADTEPGGYFAAIFLGNQPPATAEGQVSIGGRIGILVLLRVNGDVPEEGGILDFDTESGKRWYTAPPVSFTYRFSNLGGDRVVPSGTLDLTNTFGMNRASLDANQSKGSVLPGSARRFSQDWSVRDQETPSGFFANVGAQFKNFHLGWYTATLNLTWGVSDQVSTERLSFFIFPWQLVITILIIFVLVIFILKVAGKRYRAALIREIKQQQAIAIEEE